MTKQEIVISIAENYSPLSEECKKDFAEISTVLNFEKPQVIVKEGEYSDKTYFIAKGATRAFYLKDGKDITDWFAFENNFMSAINSFFMEVPSPHYVEVLEPSILLEIPRDKMMEMTDKYPEFDRLGRIIVTKVMLGLQQRIVSIQFETAQQKYENLLKTFPDITQRVALTHIASFIGITLETLSRIRATLSRI